MKYILICLLFLAACAPVVIDTPGTQEPLTPSNHNGLESFATQAEYEAFIQGQTQGFARGGIAMDTMVAEVAVESADFSQTNVQVQGVDEGDIIKTDGQYIYTVTDNTVFIIQAGQDAQEVAQIQLEDQPTGLFLFQNKLVVFGNQYNTQGLDIPQGRSITFVYEYDITNPESPQRTNELILDGWYRESRELNGDMYIITSSTPDIIRPFVFDTQLREMPVQDILYFPFPYNGVQLTTVYKINRGFETDSVAVATPWDQTVYMSTENLFIGAYEYVNEWQIRQDLTLEIITPLLDEQDTQLIERINAVDADILSQQEKQSKILQVMYNHMSTLSEKDAQSLSNDIDDAVYDAMSAFEYLDYTHITKVDIEQMQAEAAGKIPGRLYGQFALDQYDDVLRAATTTSARWQRGKQVQEQDNHVFTLDQDLQILDQISVAEGESIFSTRFMGDKLYMVTFEQVDPFFVIELSDPNNIQVLGELKITGFSRYLHPYDETHIIGFGREATENGRQQGLKISLFNVADLNNPREVAKFVADDRYASSTAEWEHKAFLFDKEKELLVLPINSWQKDATSGAMVFSINTLDINLRGIVAHTQGAQRSLTIGDELYTKSYTTLKVNDIDTLEAYTTVRLASEPEDIIYEELI